MSFSQEKPKSTIVAVVDMGVDYYKLYSLKDYMVSDSKFRHGWDFSTEDESSGIDYSYKFSGDYHGTFIAYLIARPQYKNTHRIKLLDVVYSDYYGNLFQLNQYMFPENNLQVYRRKKAYEKFSEHISKTFSYAEQMGAKVINFSSSDRGFHSAEMEQYLKSALDRNTFIVVSAGNDGLNLTTQGPQYPCSYDLDNVICVGAVNKNFNKTDYSNYGLGVDLYASGNFGEFEGTSFSAPIISRAIALIINKHPNWGVKRVREELFKFVFLKNHIPVFNHRSFHKVYL